MCTSNDSCNDYSLQSANTGIATISTANAQLTGAGAVNVFTAGGLGSIVKSITIDKKSVSSFFAPSLIQKYIEKEYEIRSFYLRGKFYSMAIFSQQNEITKTDYRKQTAKKNRRVPYALTKAVEEKLRKLMNMLNIDTGSIDLIKAKNGDMYFLEVNPSGIFNDLSYSCNYYIEQTIANILMDFKE